MATYYMHLLDGQPAAFYDDRSVCFTRKRVRLATSLRQIRREQAISKQGDDDRVKLTYDYATVHVPD